MIQLPKPRLKAKKEAGEGFDIVPVAITVFLMLSFVGATMYVLISSLTM